MSSWVYANGSIKISHSIDSKIITDIFGEHDEWDKIGMPKKRPYGSEGSIQYSCVYRYERKTTIILIEGSLRDKDPEYCEDIKNWFIDVIKKLKANNCQIIDYFIEISSGETAYMRIENGKFYERVLVEKEIDFSL